MTEDDALGLDEADRLWDMHKDAKAISFFNRLSIDWALLAKMEDLPLLMGNSFVNQEIIKLRFAGEPFAVYLYINHNIYVEDVYTVAPGAPNPHDKRVYWPRPNYKPVHDFNWGYQGRVVHSLAEIGLDISPYYPNLSTSTKH